MNKTTIIMNNQRNKFDLSVLSKAQKLQFLKEVSEKGANFRPYIERIEETFTIQESGDYKSNETGRILSLEQIRAFEDDYMFVLELVDKTVPVDRADPSQGLVPCQIQLAPYSLGNYLLYSQKTKSNGN